MIGYYWGWEMKLDPKIVLTDIHKTSISAD